MHRCDDVLTLLFDSLLGDLAQHDGLVCDRLVDLAR